MSHRHSISSVVNLDSMDPSNDEQADTISPALTSAAAVAASTEPAPASVPRTPKQRANNFTTRSTSAAKFAGDDSDPVRPPVTAARTTESTSVAVPNTRVKQQAPKRNTRRYEEDEDNDDDDEDEDDDSEIPQTPIERHNNIIRRIKISFAAMILGHVCLWSLICATLSALPNSSTFVIGILVFNAIIVTFEGCWAIFQAKYFSYWTLEEYTKPVIQRIREVKKAARQMRVLPLGVIATNLFTMLLMIYIVANSFRASIANCPEIPSDNFPLLTMRGQALFVMYILAFIFQAIGCLIVEWVNHDLVSSVKSMKPCSVEYATTPMIPQTLRGTVVAAPPARNRNAKPKARRAVSTERSNGFAETDHTDAIDIGSIVGSIV